MIPIQIFGDLSTEFARLLDAEDYASALTLVEQAGDKFPEEAWHISEWRIVAAALCRDDAAVLTYFRAALDAGQWYPVARFRREFFAPLQGDAMFEALVERCAACEAEAAQHTYPRLTLDYPAAKPAPYPLWVALHRNHANLLHDTPYWHSVVQAGYLLAMPESSQVMGPDVHIWDDRARAVAEVVAHVQMLNSTQVDVKRVIWSGYMSGADVAIRAALSGAVPATGIIAISPVTPTVDHLMPLVEAAAARGLRAYIFIGERDRRCYPGAVQLAEFLKANGIPTRLHVRLNYTFGIPDDFAARLKEAEAFILADK